MHPGQCEEELQWPLDIRYRFDTVAMDGIMGIAMESSASTSVTQHSS